MTDSKSADLRDFLKALYLDKKARNAKFSLRAWASQLDLSVAVLSKLLRKEAPLSLKKFEHLCVKLELTSAQVNFYRPSVKVTPRRAPLSAIASLAKTKHVQADWISAVLLESVNLYPRISNKEIAKKLGVDEKQIRLCLRSLKESGLVDNEDDGKFGLRAEYRTTTRQPHVTPDLSARQIQALQKSIDAIRNISPDERDHSAVTFAMAPCLVPIAKEKIKNFRRELATFLEANSAQKTAIYEMTIGLFPAL